ncbi:MAG: AsmA family protein [Rhodospirillaceae bacterium]|nr:AsmA family protein [Rhodospirillaceae bacterium]
MNKILIIIAGLLVTLVAAVLIVPGFMNWNQYRGMIQTEAAAATGRAVEIDGDIRIQLLPAPRLVIENARLANVEGASSADMVTLKRLEVHVALAPLFSGAVRVQSVILVEPELRLEILEDGRNNFTFTPVAKTAPSTAPQPASQPGTSSDAPDAPLFDFRPQLSIDNFTIEGGRVSFKNAGNGRTETIDNLNGRFAMAALKGPWEASGSAVVRGIPLSFLGSTGAIVQGRTLPFNFDLTAIPGTVRSQFSGALTNLQDAPSVKGKIAISGKSLDAILSATAGLPASGGALARPFGIDANVVASASSANITGIGVRFTDTQMSGAIKVKTGKATEIEISLAANRLDLDGFLRTPAPVAAKPAGKGAVPPPTSPPALKANKPAAGQAKAKPAAVIDLTRLPKNLSATVNLSVEAVTYRGQPIRQAKLNYSLASQEITLNQFSALLPGNTDVALFGFITQSGGAPQFGGNLDATTSDLRKFLSWLDIDTGGVAAGKLRQLTLAAKLAARPDAARLRDFKLRFDGTTVSGDASVLLGARPGIDATISVDRINLDSYLAKVAAPKRTGRPASAAAATKEPEAAPKATSAELPSLGALAGIDAQLRAQVKTLIFHGLPVRGIAADMVLASGDLRIDRLRVADAGGINASLSGALTGLTKANPRLGNVNFRIEGKNLNRFFKLAKITPPIPVRGLGRLALSGTVSGGLAGIQIKSNAQAFGGKVILDGKIKSLIGTPQMEMGFNIQHRDLARLVRNLGTDYRPKKGRIGGLSVSGFLTGTTDKMKITSIEGDIGGVAIGGNVDVNLRAKVPSIDARLNTSDIDIERFLPASKKAAASPPAPLLWRASWPGVTARQSAGTAGIIPAQAARGGRWSRAPIDLAGLHKFGGNLAVKSDSVKFGKLRLVNADLTAALNRGTLNINKLTGLVFGGDLRLDGSVAGGPGGAQLVARYTLANLDAAAAQAAFGGRQITRGRMSASGELGAVGANQAALIASLNGRGTAALKRIGVDTSGTGRSVLSGLAGVLRSVNKLGAVLGGRASNSLADINGAYTINNGVVAFNDLTLASDLGKGSMRGTVDLPGWRIKADGQLDLVQTLATALLLKNTRRRPSIPFSVRGALDAPRVKLETGKLPGGGIRLPIPALEKLRKKNRGAARILDKILPGLSGGQAPAPAPPPRTSAPAPQPAPAPEPRREKPKVEDLLKGILRGLTR